MFRQKKMDRDNYVTFVTENKEMLYRIAYAYLHDSTKAMDAVDEVIYIGYVHIHELKEWNFLKTWITRILIHECYKILRKSKREYAVEELPEDSVNLEDDYIYLKLAVKSLPEDLRKIIVLRYFGAYTISETADILEIPEGTVASRTRKALAILKVEVSE